MKRFYILLAVLSLFAADSSKAATQDELYVSFYQMIQQADSLIGRKQEQAAVELYRSARAGLEKLRKDNPGWNKQIVDFRLDYIAGKLDPLDANYPVDKPAPKPAAKPGKALKPQVQTELSAISDNLIKERMISADLRNKLQEALAAKPTEVDPAAHAKALEDLGAARQQSQALSEELAALKKQAEDMIAADEAKQLKKAMEDSERLASKRAKDLESLQASYDKLSGQLEKLEKEEIPALRSENTALKRQVGDLEKQAGKTDSAEKSAQQLTVQNKLLARELEEARDRQRDAERKVAKMVDKSALAKTASELKDRTDELARKDAALVKLQRELDALEVRVKNAGESEKNSSLRRENSALKKELSDLRKKAREADKIPALEAELKKLEADAKRQAKALEDLAKEKNKIEKLLLDPDFKINQ